jgi:hypothetical protein
VIRSVLLALALLCFAGSALAQASNPGSASLSPIGAGDVVGNSTGSSAVPSDTTLTSLLDANFSSAQGSILYRSASGWVALAPGASGTFLKTLGASANPAWNSVCLPAGSVNQMLYDSGAGGCLDTAITVTAGGAITDPIAGAANAPGVYFIGSLFSGGTTSNNSPFMYFNFGATPVTSFNTGGALIGYNRASGSTADFLDEWTNGGSVDFTVNAGNISAQADIRIGSAPTIGGSCTTASYVGGQTAGFFTATCTSQTIIFTFVKTVTNGYICKVEDETTPTDTVKQTSHSTNSCTVTGTTASSDHMTFVATGA